VRALVLGSILALIPACPGDDTCGPGDAPGDGLVLSGSGVLLRYHMMEASANNDCPDPAAPAGVVSVTLLALQVGGGDAINLCVPRPDRLAEPLVLGADVEVVDVNGAAGGCTFVHNSAQPPTGTMTAEGACANGTDPAGFKLVVAGQVSVDRTCDATTDTLRLDLAGAISVATP
jgi:hypothetical protein